ncbi:MAG: hypothetical protein HUU02_03065 [Bacteroidetes bacterium]|nr:hypothetical protein [Bacteroidota bacterium]
MRWFTAGSILLLLTCLFHLLGHFSGWNPSQGQERQLYELMVTYRLQPIDVTMMDLYLGFSLFYGLFFLSVGTIALLLRRMLEQNVPALQTIARVIALFLAIGTGVSFRYFFAAPLVCITAAFICFVIASFTVKIRSQE